MGDWTAGQFVWLENGTPDVAKAKKFYTALLGWDYEDVPMPGGQGTYTLIKVDGKQLGGMHSNLPDGMPAHWASYIQTDSTDDTVAKVKEAGGTVLTEPFDVPDQGRMAVLQDPTGGFFCCWQPKGRADAGKFELQHGTPAWNELVTPDTEKAGKFYVDVFDWRPETQEMPDGTKYTTFWAGEQRAGGMFETPQEGIPPHWAVYFSTDDTDDSVKKAEANGGSVLMPATDIPEVGRFAALQDPNGVAFSVIKLLPQAK